MTDEGLSEMSATNVPYLVVCSLVAVWLLCLLVAFRIRFYDSPPIVAILALLLLNSFLEMVFELPGYFENTPNSVCLVSITGVTFFRLASYYWLIFVSRLAFRERVQPGKFIDLSSYISRHIIATYIPSVVVAVLVVIVANLDETQSEANCWRRISQKELSDYIIYLASFVLPNLIALLAVLSYLIAYFRVQQKASISLCLFFPLVALPFMIYYLVLKLMTFFGEWNVDNLLELPLLCQSFGHGVIFAVVLRNVSRGKRPTSSDLTIAEESSLTQTLIAQGEVTSN